MPRYEYRPRDLANDAAGHAERGEYHIVLVRAMEMAAAIAERLQDIADALRELRERHQDILDAQTDLNPPDGGH